VEEARQDLLAGARFTFDQDLVRRPRKPGGLGQLELPFGPQGGRVGFSGSRLQAGFREASRRVAEEEEGVADLDQVAVAKWNHLASLRPLAVDQGPVPGAFVPQPPGAVAPFEMGVARGGEGVAQVDAQLSFCGAAAGRRCAADIHFVD